MLDPFRVLGLDAGATADDVRSARRELAKQHHPDAGGDADRMREINEAAGAALRALADGAATRAGGGAHATSANGAHATSANGAHATSANDVESTPAESRPSEPDIGLTRDVPSFTVEALPVETFEALLVVTSWIGEVIDDDPPYRLDVLLHAHGAIEHPCWCRLELVPDAGASTVSIGIASYDDQPLPPIVAVRDFWVAQLNRYDWH